MHTGELLIVANPCVSTASISLANETELDAKKHLLMTFETGALGLVSNCPRESVTLHDKGDEACQAAGTAFLQSKMGSAHWRLETQVLKDHRWTVTGWKPVDSGEFGFAFPISRFNSIASRWQPVQPVFKVNGGDAYVRYLLAVQSK